jgi:NAD(P)-dependent dehydrogenase (short-subunit alcohol dehydrogenase family)
MRVAVITGASSGIGAAAASALAAEGWRVAVVGRNPERTAAVAERIGGDAFIADYDRLDDVRALAAALLERYDRLDLLANNAGGLVKVRARTVDGHERTIQHNHLAPFLLTERLLPLLEASGGRMIATASNANEWAAIDVDDLDRDHKAWLGGWPAYGAAKLANVLFAAELARRSPIWSASYHPGFVSSSWGQDTVPLRLYKAIGGRAFARTPEAGAAPIVHLAGVEEPPAPSGTFFNGLRPNGRTHRLAHDPAVAAALWERSIELVGV